MHIADMYDNRLAPSCECLRHKRLFSKKYRTSRRNFANALAEITSRVDSLGPLASPIPTFVSYSISRHDSTRRTKISTPTMNSSLDVITNVSSSSGNPQRSTYMHEHIPVNGSHHPQGCTMKHLCLQNSRRWSQNLQRKNTHATPPSKSSSTCSRSKRAPPPIGFVLIDLARYYPEAAETHPCQPSSSRYGNNDSHPS